MDFLSDEDVFGAGGSSSTSAPPSSPSTKTKFLSDDEVFGASKAPTASAEPNFYERNKAFVAPGVKDSDFVTKLAPAEESEFETWVKENKVPFDPAADPAKQDYDMRGFWKGLKAGDPHATTGIDPNDKKLHFTDYWKTPYHESFSRESKFAGDNAPTWKGDQLVTNDGTVLYDDAAPKGDKTADGGGFFSELGTAFKRSIVHDNPQALADSLEMASVLAKPDDREPTLIERGLKLGERISNPVGALGEDIGRVVDIPGALKGAADTVRGWAGSGENMQPAVGQIKDIRSVGDAVSWFGSALGSAAGSSAPSVATGLATAAATKNPVLGFFGGAFGPSYIQNSGDTYSTLRDDPGVQQAIKDGKITEKEVAGWAAVASVPIAALDAYGAGEMLPLKKLKGEIVSRVLKRIIHGGLAEGATEGFQQVLQEATLAAVGGDHTLSDAAYNVFENFAQGAVGGGAISAATGALNSEGKQTGVPEGAASGDVLYGPEGQVQAAPAPQAAPETFVINDPEVDGYAAGEGHGETVTLAPDQTLKGKPINPNMRRVILPDGTPKIIGVSLLQPVAPAAPPAGSPAAAVQQATARTPEAAAPATAPPAGQEAPKITLPPAPGVDTERAASPRLTPEDRASPIPNDIIDDGKALIEAATKAGPSQRPIDPATVPAAPVANATVAPERIDRASLLAAHTDANGALDLRKAGEATKARVTEALANGDTVDLYIEGKLRRIVDTKVTGLVDDKGQPWGIAPVLMPAPGDDARIEITPAAKPAAAAAPLSGPLLADHEVFTSEKPAATPTEAQAVAGNYQKRHVKWQGMNISVETEQGQERSGKAPDGTAWSVKMPVPYGYIKRTEGADGDQVDVYLGNENHSKVFVVDQIDPKTGKFDEHKNMLGFDTRESALAAYNAAFSDGSGPTRSGAVTEMSVDQFKDWVKNGDTSKPVAPQDVLKAKVAVRSQNGEATKPAQNITENIPTGGKWLDTLDENARAGAKEEVVELSKKSDKLYSGAGRDTGVAIGTTDRRAAMEAEAYREIAGRITNDGVSPEEAGRLAKVSARQMIERHNAVPRGSDEIMGQANWNMDPSALDQTIDYAVDRIKRGSERGPASVADAKARQAELPEGYTFKQKGRSTELYAPDGKMLYHTENPNLDGLVESARKHAGIKTVDVKLRARGKIANPDIIQFIAMQGGVKDFGGELKSLDLKNRFVPGWGKVVRESGRPLDTIREAAAQDGYFDHIYGDPDTASQKSTVADLLRLIDQNERGQLALSTQGRQGREAAAAEKGAGLTNEEAARQADYDEVLKAYGEVLPQEYLDELEQRVRDGEWASEAAADLSERWAIAIEAETSDSAASKEPEFDASPFFDAPPHDTLPEGDTGEETSDQGGGRQEAGAGEAPRVEAGREGARDNEQPRSQPQEKAQLNPKAEVALDALEIVPNDGWRENLIKTRVYAKKLIDAKSLDGDEAALVWTDKKELVALVDDALENARVQLAVPTTPKPERPTFDNPLYQAASDAYSTIWDRAVANPTAAQLKKLWWEQQAEQITNPARYGKVVQEDNPAGLKIGDEATLAGHTGIVTSISTQGTRQAAHISTVDGYGVWHDVNDAPSKTSKEQAAEASKPAAHDARIVSMGATAFKAGQSRQAPFKTSLKEKNAAWYAGWDQAKLSSGRGDAAAVPARADEPGAEGKPQTLLPGVAPVTDKDRTDVQAAKPLKGKVPQKEPGGLFGDEKNQTDIGDLLGPTRYTAKGGGVTVTTPFQDVAEQHADRTGGTVESSVSPNTIITEDAYAKALAVLKAKLGGAQLNAGIDPEVMAAGITAAAYHIERGARTFAAYAKAMLDTMGEVARPYLKSWYLGVKFDPKYGHLAGGMTGAGEVETADVSKITVSEPVAAPKPAPAATPRAPGTSLVDVSSMGAVFGKFFADQKNSFANINQARKFVADRMGITIAAGTAEAKAVDEAVEIGVVIAARGIVRDTKGEQKTFDLLRDLYQRQPSLNVRTSTSVADQAYSTPIPLAYVASRLAQITKDTSVLEPTAGNGALLIEASPGKVTANELNSDRADQLRSQGFRVSSDDASAGGLRHVGYPVDVVIANPPFGVVRNEFGASKQFKVDERYTTTEIDHAISLKSLESIKDDGSAVLILGGVNKLASTREARSDAYNGKSKREFYYTLYNLYNVVDHFTVAGELYEKQGAGWPVDVIVIRGKGKSARKLPAVDVPRILKTWDEVKGLLDGDAAADRPTRPTGEPSIPDTGRTPEGGPAASDERPAGPVPGSGPDRAGSQPAAEQPAVVQPGPDRPERSPAPEAQREPDARVRPGNEGEDAGSVRGRPGLAIRPTEADAETAPVLASNVPPIQPPAPKGPVKPAETEDRQVTYAPQSNLKGMGTLVPVNMQTTVRDSLNALERRVGAIDAYVAKELGYKEGELGKYFAAEQVDALALAIDNFSRDSGFIIGDQTGIGKGRVVAGILKWSMMRGKTPIFVTERPNLYADMYRDLTAIGVKNPRILMTNAAQEVSLTEDDSVILKTPGAALHNALLRKMAASGKLEGYDLIFTNYSQMQTVKEQETDRMQFLRAMVRANGVIAFDESHNAGGTEVALEDEKMNRAQFARELVGAADAVLYSSATYAKRPGVMGLYAKTDMRLAVDDDIAKLGDLISKGGVPMQQIVAAMLSKVGQYIRRERSFDGVVYDSPVIPVDRAVYERFSTTIKSIQLFSEDFVSEAAANLDEQVKGEAESVTGDGSTGGAGASSTNFTSVMHNLINQMLLSIKADKAADEAIASLKKGEKPVITLANTLESMLTEFADTAGAKVGDAITLTFNSLLFRYLERSRTVIIKKPFAKKGESIRHYLTDAQLGPEGVRAYNEAKALIQSGDFKSLPASPIDWIKARIRKAGYSVGEITGRSMIVDYRADGVQTLDMRDGEERSIKGRVKMIRGFNSGAIDVLIVNQAGATGLSLHASSDFKNQNKRHMILAQAEGNIDTHMQILGRVHRTGQVVLPRYSQLVADVPAEKRPASVLAKKMASLNANTTASRDSALTAKDVPDFMNVYGDHVAAAVMYDNPEIHEELGEPLHATKSGLNPTDAMRKITGRIPLLPIRMQEDVYDMLEGEYKSHIAQLEAAGENALEAKTLPLDARLIDRREVREAKNAASPFASAVHFDTVDVKMLGRPMTSAQMLEAVAETLGATGHEITKENAESVLRRFQREGAIFADKMASKARNEFQAYKTATLDDLKEDARKSTETRLNDILTRWNAIVQLATPGQGVVLKTTSMGNLYGVVTKTERTGKTKNPLALGSWKVTIALADASRQMTIPLSQLYTARTAPSDPAASMMEIGTVNSVGSLPLTKAFDDLQSARREERIVVTGNLLAGYDVVDSRGQIVNYTDNEGNLQQGIMMRRDFDPDTFLNSKPVRLPMSDHVIRYLDMVKGDVSVYSNDRFVGVKKLPNGDLRIITDGTKGGGGRYFLNKTVLAAAGKDFVKASGEMRIDVPPTTALRVLDALKKAGAVFEASSNLDVANQVVGAQMRGQMLAIRGDVIRGDVLPLQTHSGEITDAFKEKASEVGQRLRKALDNIGLPDVGLRLSEWVNIVTADGTYQADGRYEDSLIEVALDSDNPDAVVDHEIIHALRDLGAFKDAEWAILERQSKKKWMAHYEIAKGYASWADWAQVEEGIAHAYADWVKGARMDGIIAKSFKKITAALRAIRSALTGSEFRTADDIFAKVASGKLGQRRRDASTQSGPMLQRATRAVTETAAFKRWFGDSKVVDAKGEPLVVYHGAGEKRSEFKKQKGTRYTLGRSYEVEAGAFFFTPERDFAKTFGKELTGVYLKAEKLLDLTEGAWGQNDEAALEVLKNQFGQNVGFFPAEDLWELLDDPDSVRRIRDLGYDAVMLGERDSDHIMRDVYAVFEPTQIKSVNNSGTFDPANPRIMAAMRRGDLTEDVNGSKVTFDDHYQARFFRLGRALMEQNGIEPAAIDEQPYPKLLKNDGLSKETSALIEEIGPFLVQNSVRSKEPVWRGEGAQRFTPVQFNRRAFMEAAMESAAGVMDEASSKPEMDAGSVIEPDRQQDWFRKVIADERSSAKPQQIEIPATAPTAERKRATRAQQDASGLPLFSDERNQGSLFSLRRPPANAQESQQAMQGFIARGQPIDRAVRIPWDILGGTNELGEWIPGKRLTDKVGPAGTQGAAIGGTIGAGIGTLVAGPVGTLAGAAAGGTIGAYLLSANIPTSGRFRFMRGITENARRGLIDRYGLPAEYIATERGMERHRRSILVAAEPALAALMDKKMSAAEAQVLGEMLTTKDGIDNSALGKLAQPIRQAIDELGAEAVSYGLIDAESYERNRGAYLHRVYMKHEAGGQGTMAGWISGRMAVGRKKFMADEMKGRGMFWDVPVDRLMKDIPDFQEGIVGAPVKGDTFRVLDNVLSPTDDMLTGEERGKTARRVYWPAEDMVPAKYTGPEWKDRGVWEVRKEGKKQVTLWRDYTKEERTKMGEILDARYTVGKTFLLLANDLATGRFFKDVSENENWTQSTPPAQLWKNAEEYTGRYGGGRFWNDPEVAWVKVPDTDIAGTGGKKRWGALAGKFVRSEIWRDMNETDVAMNPGAWRKLLNQWKLNKTARNPVVHMNNIMSNLMFMDLADVRMQDLAKGIAAYYHKNADYEEARDHGAFGKDMMSQEIRDNVLKPMLDQIAKAQLSGKAQVGFLARAGDLGKLADILWTWAKTADGKMIDAYRAEDELFRMATFIRRKSQGESPEVAAQNARDQFLDYDIKAPWVVAARNTALPFISYSYRAIPKLMESIAHRPWKLAKYFAIAAALNALSYGLDDGDDGEDRERAALRDNEQGWTWLGVPRMARMPWRDSSGMPVFLDIRRWIPSGDVFDTQQGSSAIPIPAALQFGGPLMLAAEFALNRQAFTGNDITNDLTDDNSDMAENVADWAWKSWAPSAFWVPNSWYWEKIRLALRGAEDNAGRKYSVPQAFLSSVGVKVRPLDVEDGLFWHSYDFKQVQKALRAQYRSIGRKLDRNMISQAEFDRQAADITEKFSNLQIAVDEFGERSQKKAK